MKKVSLVFDMRGCPNRCKHCWLGHMPNRKLAEELDLEVLNYFKPYFEKVEFYSWLREPDYFENYRKRFNRDCEISIGTRPQRFELGSFYMLVRDPEYVHFLKDVGTEMVQLTFFGMEALTDKYVGRKGVFKELEMATDILLRNDIGVRYQLFINQENVQDLENFLIYMKEKHLVERSKTIGKGFNYFVHSGSCTGENFKLYSLRIEEGTVPSSLIPYFLSYDKNKSEREWLEELRDSKEYFSYPLTDKVVLNISNTLDVYFNYTHLEKEWCLGNIREIPASEMMEKIKSQKVPALDIARSITLGELANLYGDNESTKLFELADFKEYLLHRHLDTLRNEGKI